MASIISAGTTSGTALNMTADTSGQLQLATGSSATTALTIDTSQNVGIGTASPGAKLDISSAVVGDVNVRAYNTSNNASARSVLLLGNDTSSTAFGIYLQSSTNSGLSGTNSVNLYQGTANPMCFWTNGSERMRIDSSGNVLVGTTSQVLSGKFCMSAALNGAAFITTSGSSYSAVLVQRTASTGDFIEFVNQAGSANIGWISTANNTTVSYNSASDYRLKENIAPMTGALDKVSALKPVTYTWKDGGSTGQGFIAHELQAIVPDCVSGEKDAVETYTDEDGIEQTRPKYQGVDTSFLVATLTAAIQEQQTIINDLKARVTALESK